MFANLAPYPFLPPRAVSVLGEGLCERIEWRKEAEKGKRKKKKKGKKGKN